MLLLVKIMKVTIMLSNLNKERRKRPLTLLSLMMKTGSPMRISTSNFTTHTTLRNLVVKILELELLLLTMISQDKLLLKTLKVLRFPHPSLFAISLF